MNERYKIVEKKSFSHWIGSEIWGSKQNEKENPGGYGKGNSMSVPSIYDRI